MNFFNSEERKRQKELDRKIKIKEGRRRLDRYIQKQKENLLKYRKLAKRAHRVGDESMFRQIALFILRTQRDIMQWERRILYFDMVEARKDQVLAAAEFAKAYEVMAQSMLPPLRLATVWFSASSTGVPLSAVIRSAWVADDTRTRRPARSDSDVMAVLQNSTCAG